MDQERRVGLNEALFRQVNEEVRNLGAENLGTHDEKITVICECGDPECTERLDLGVSDYERVRSDSLLYVVASGHGFPDAERVVEQRDDWEIVRKVGEAAEVAEETDPRS
jgi:hypothetical protein